MVRYSDFTQMYGGIITGLASEWERLLESEIQIQAVNSNNNNNNIGHDDDDDDDDDQMMMIMRKMLIIASNKNNISNK